MIAIDTNVLVRFLVADDAKQHAAAMALIERSTQNGERIFISQVVLCELVWVLSYAYEYPRKEIAAVLNDLRRASQVEIEDPDQVGRALELYASSRGDFADYVLAERALARGCTSVATFDRVLLNDSRFSAP